PTRGPCARTSRSEAVTQAFRRCCGCATNGALFSCGHTMREPTDVLRHELSRLASRRPIWSRAGAPLFALLACACTSDAPTATADAGSGAPACVDTKTPDGYYCCCGEPTCS